VRFNQLGTKWVRRRWIASFLLLLG
jgi:hypothetical protein